MICLTYLMEKKKACMKCINRAIFNLEINTFKKVAFFLNHLFCFFPDC